MSSIAVALVTVALPFSPAAHALGLVSLSARLVAALGAITAGTCSRPRLPNAASRHRVRPPRWTEPRPGVGRRRCPQWRILGS